VSEHLNMKIQATDPVKVVGKISGCQINKSKTIIYGEPQATKREERVNFLENLCKDSSLSEFDVECI